MKIQAKLYKGSNALPSGEKAVLLFSTSTKKWFYEDKGLVFLSN